MSVLPELGLSKISIQKQLLRIASYIINKLANIQISIQYACYTLCVCVTQFPLQFASSLGSTAEDRNKVEELGSLVAQLRERMAELDRAVTAVSNAVSQGMGPTREALPEDEADSARKYVDMSSFEALQELLGQLHSEQERLIGTAAHLSHEVGVSKEHVKVQGNRFYNFG